MFRRLKVLNLLLVLFVVVSLVGCGAPKGEETTGGKELEQVFRSSFPSDLKTLDPAYAVDVRDGLVSGLIYNGLVKYGKATEIVSDIAEDWTITSDTVYTFKLKKGVKFTNGKEVTAEDFKYSFERVLSPETASPRSWVFEMIKGAQEFMEGKAEEVTGIKVIDDYTLEITLKEPFAPFLGFLAMPAAYVVDKDEVKKWGEDYGAHPVGTGPFKLESWERNNKVVLVKNQNYFEAGKPKLDKIVYRIIPEDMTRIAEFESGNLDVLEIPGSEFENFKNNPKWKDLILGQADLSIYYLGLNNQKPPFDNIKVRQAINYAIDTATILKTIGGGRGVLAHGPIPPGVEGYRKDGKGYSYDPEKAKAFLKEAGWVDSDGDGILDKDGKPFKMEIWQSQSKNVLQVTEAMQRYLQDIGIDAKIIMNDWSVLKQAVAEGKPDSFYMSWWADYPDAENFLYPLFHSSNWGSGGNRARYKNEEIDKLIEAARVTADHDKRIALYKEIEQKIVDEAPWVFYSHSVSFVVHQPWVKGYKLHPMFNGNKMTEVYIDKSKQ